MGDAALTYAQLEAKGGRTLKVFACDLNTSWIQEFSADTTPDVCVAHSVRASMSIPLFFHAWQFPDGIPNDHIYVDGGAIYNYPIEAFKEGRTVGFFFQTPKSGVTSDFGYNHLLKYVEVLFKSVLNAQKIDFKENSEQVEKTVFIDTHGISPTDFKLDAIKKQTLFESGRSATHDYLNKNV